MERYERKSFHLQIQIMISFPEKVFAEDPGGDRNGTLSGWTNTMIDKILIFHNLEHKQHDGDVAVGLKSGNSNGTNIMATGNGNAEYTQM